MKHTEVIEMLKNGMSTAEIAKHFKTSRKAVNNCISTARTKDPSVPKISDFTRKNGKSKTPLTNIEPYIYRSNISGKFVVRLTGLGQKTFETLDEAKEFVSLNKKQDRRRKEAKSAVAKQSPTVTLQEIDMGSNSGHILLVTHDRDLISSIIEQVRSA